MPTSLSASAQSDEHEFNEALRRCSEARDELVRIQDELVAQQVACGEMCRQVREARDDALRRKQKRAIEMRRKEQLDAECQMWSSQIGRLRMEFEGAMNEAAQVANLVRPYGSAAQMQAAAVKPVPPAQRSVSQPAQFPGALAMIGGALQSELAAPTAPPQPTGIVVQGLSEKLRGLMDDGSGDGGSSLLASLAQKAKGKIDEKIDESRRHREEDSDRLARSFNRYSDHEDGIPLMKKRGEPESDRSRERSGTTAFHVGDASTRSTPGSSAKDVALHAARQLFGSFDPSNESTRLPLPSAKTDLRRAEPDKEEEQEEEEEKPVKAIIPARRISGVDAAKSISRAFSPQPQPVASSPQRSPDDTALRPASSQIFEAAANVARAFRPPSPSPNPERSPREADLNPVASAVYSVVEALRGRNEDPQGSQCKPSEVKEDWTKVQLEVRPMSLRDGKEEALILQTLLRLRREPGFLRAWKRRHVAVVGYGLHMWRENAKDSDMSIETMSLPDAKGECTQIGLHGQQHVMLLKHPRHQVPFVLAFDTDSQKIEWIRAIKSAQSEGQAEKKRIAAGMERAKMQPEETRGGITAYETRTGPPPVQASQSRPKVRFNLDNSPVPPAAQQTVKSALAASNEKTPACAPRSVAVTEPKSLSEQNGSKRAASSSYDSKPLPGNVPRPPKGCSEEDLHKFYRDQIFALYSYYEPHKLRAFQRIVGAFGGREKSAYELLLKKYSTMPPSWADRVTAITSKHCPDRTQRLLAAMEGLCDIDKYNQVIGPLVAEFGAEIPK